MSDRTQERIRTLTAELVRHHALMAAELAEQGETTSVRWRESGAETRVSFDADCQETTVAVSTADDRVVSRLPFEAIRDNARSLAETDAVRTLFDAILGDDPAAESSSPSEP